MATRTRSRTVALLIASGVLVSIATGHAAAGEPRAVVAGLQDGLLAHASASASGDFAERYARLEPLIRDSHDFDTIARLVTGAHWRAFTPRQREDFTDLFRQLSTALYARRFSESGSAHFVHVDSEARPRESILVRTRLIRAEDEPVEFDYLLHKVGNHWRIINIFVDQISDLALRRSEYTALLDTGGFGALLAHLREQIRAQADTE